jgi:hypothetical protein
MWLFLSRTRAEIAAAIDVASDWFFAASHCRKCQALPLCLPRAALINQCRLEQSEVAIYQLRVSRGLSMA